MIRVWKSEIRKLLRPRFIISNFLVAIILQLSLTITMMLKAKGDLVQDLNKSTGLFYGTKSIAGFLGIITFCIFAANFAQEYNHGTLKNLLVREPNRTVLIIGKLIAVITFTAAMITTVAVLSGITEFALASKGHVNTDKWNFVGIGFLAPLGNVLLAAFAYGALGAALAVILRSSITSISAGLVWLLVIETLFGFVGRTISKWLPGGNLANFADGGSKELSYLHSASITSIYAFVAVATLVIIFNMRDVAN
jgi:ABC-type transport system involved in multi-copper enzyme maturation permease subunit